MPECFGSHFNLSFVTREKKLDMYSLEALGSRANTVKPACRAYSRQGNHKPMTALLPTTLQVMCIGIYQHEVAPWQPI